MKRSKYFGWKEVCRFTFMQSTKSKAMKITLAILCAIVMLPVPLISLFSSLDNEDEKETKSVIETVYVYSEKDGLVDYYLSGLKDENYKHISFQEIDSEKEYLDKQKELEKADEDCKAVLVNLLCDEDYNSLDYGMEYRVIYGVNSGVTDEDAEMLAYAMQEERAELFLADSNLDESVLEELSRTTYFEITVLDDSGAEIDLATGLNEMEYAVTYGWLMVSMLVILLTGSKVAELIVTEKTSKVMEYLLTSVQPLALLLGKVLSALLITLYMFAALIVSFLISLVFHKCVFGGAFIPEYLSNIVSGGTLENFNLLTLMVALLITFAGYMFYELLAGLAGATVGKVEELAEGLKLFSFAILIGLYLGLFLIMLSAGDAVNEGFEAFVCYFPLSSVFVTPAYLLIGRCTLVEALISLGIVVVAAVGMWIFVSGIFAHILYHNSNVLKLKDILSLYKDIRGGSHGKEK